MGAPELGRTACRRLRAVGISEMLVTRAPGDTLITYSLGSCLGVTLYDPVAGLGAMIHCMLPLSKQARDPANLKRAMYVDTGFVDLLDEAFAQGATRERLVVKVAGAASPMDANGRFRIGERNLAVLRKILWRNELLIAADDTGGTRPRTMSLEVATGRTLIKSPGEVREL